MYNKNCLVKLTMEISMAHCLFEQSGIFKKAFRELGITAYDYDIKNDFGETEMQTELFSQIFRAYNNKPSIFDGMIHEDLIMAFFPCTYFCCNNAMFFQGKARYSYKQSLEEKLRTDIERHTSLHRNYITLSMLTSVALRRNLRLIIENPASEPNYLTRYWCIRPTIKDNDRTRMGDAFKKPTNWWFINCYPTYKISRIGDKKRPAKQVRKVAEKERSLFTAEYARNFIKEFLLDTTAGSRQYK